MGEKTLKRKSSKGKKTLIMQINYLCIIQENCLMHFFPMEIFSLSSKSNWFRRKIFMKTLAATPLSSCINNRLNQCMGVERMQVQPYNTCDGIKITYCLFWLVLSYLLHHSNCTKVTEKRCFTGLRRTKNRYLVVDNSIKTAN